MKEPYKVLAFVGVKIDKGHRLAVFSKNECVNGAVSGDFK